MKRNIDTVRDILIALENASLQDQVLEDAVPNCTQEQFFYHVKLMAGAGLIEATEMSALYGVWYPNSLTWQGHEFLDDIRDDTVWNRTKDKVGDKVSTVSLAVVQEVAKGIARHLLGLH